MDTIERIEELKREIVKQKLLIESEEAKIEKVKRCCGVVPGTCRRGCMGYFRAYDRMQPEENFRE